jgi:Alternate to MurJ
MDTQLLVVCVLTFVIHLVGTLAYAARIAGVRTRRIAVSFSLFNILILVSRGFLDWAKSWYGDCVIAEGQEPGVYGKNKSGWIRVNAVGEVVELFERTIRGVFFDWFEGTDNSVWRWSLALETLLPRCRPLLSVWSCLAQTRCLARRMLSR